MNKKKFTIAMTIKIDRGEIHLHPPLPEGQKPGLGANRLDVGTGEIVLRGRRVLYKFLDV